MQGFKRGILLHDAKSGTVHSLQIWKDAQSLKEATTRNTEGGGSIVTGEGGGDGRSTSMMTEYEAAMANVAKAFLPGSVPEVSELTVLGDFTGPPSLGENDRLR
jgi:hypothetical protein